MKKIDDFLIEQFDTWFEYVKNATTLGNYNDMINWNDALIHIMLSRKNTLGVFVMEVMEGVFIQFKDLLNVYYLDKRDIEKETRVLIDHISRMVIALKDKNAEKTYHELVEIRVYVTNLQLIEYPQKYNTRFHIKSRR